MQKLLALQVPGYDAIGAPQGVPTGGLAQGSSIAQWGLTLVIIVAIVVALFMLIYSGVQWIQSGGDKQKVEAARHRIIYTIIGLVVIFLSFMIVNVVGTVFGVNLLGNNNSKSNHIIDKKAKTDRVPNRPGQQRSAP